MKPFVEATCDMEMHRSIIEFSIGVMRALNNVHEDEQQEFASVRTTTTTYYTRDPIPLMMLTELDQTPTALFHLLPLLPCGLHLTCIIVA